LSLVTCHPSHCHYPIPAGIASVTHHSSHCHIPIPAGIASVTSHSVTVTTQSQLGLLLSLQSLSLPNPSWDSYVTQSHFLVTLIYNLAKFNTLHHFHLFIWSIPKITSQLINRSTNLHQISFILDIFNTPSTFIIAPSTFKSK